MSDSYSESQKKMTKECIFTALMRLLDREQWSGITITQITKLAGVSRMAFYRNYRVKEDIINVYLDELFEELTGKFASLVNADKYDALVAFFSFFKEKNAFIRTLIKSGLTHIFFEKLCRYMEIIFKDQPDKIRENPAHSDYIARFTAAGLYNILIEWNKRNMVESVEDMAKLVAEITD